MDQKSLLDNLSESQRLLLLKNLDKYGITLTENPSLDLFLTQDKDMLAMKVEVSKLCDLTEPVLILGETGTGKELIAKALHGSRKGKFVAINITSLPDLLLESELFGHKKGSFTGAFEDRVGLFEEAKDGTLFLDEIGEMPLQLQAKLLRVLQENKIRRVGENTERQINPRLVFATNRLIGEMLLKQSFRVDLYFRISTFTVQLKALRDRLDDIDLICQSLNITERNIIDLLKAKITLSTLNGNVRELQNYILRYNKLGKL